ncbi:MAG: hypothetical protein NZ777_14505, partial [Pseudomonadales bacterium]|nr:hypothetical protein [Pseudomonadales bacterium]
MAGGNHNAAAGMTIVMNGEVEGGCGYLAQVHDIDAAGNQSCLQGIGQFRRAESGIAANINCLFTIAANQCAQCFTQAIGEV